MSVNDPLLLHLMITWLPEKISIGLVFWNELNEKFKDDANTLKLFEEYMPAYKNVSSYVIRLYNEDEPIATQ